MMDVEESARWDALQKIAPSVSRETAERLAAYAALVVKWQARINLIANATVAELWTRHILDSVQLFPLKPDAKNWCDIGSGGGFPGLVIAIMLKEQPNGYINLVESNGKKAAFLRTVIAELDLPASVYHCRIEDVYEKIPQPEILTARALASLDLLFHLSEPWLSQKTTALMQKGRDYQSEIDDAHANWSFDLVKYNSKIDPQSVILEISNLRSVSMCGSQKG